MLTGKHFLYPFSKLLVINQGLLHAKRLRLNNHKDHAVLKLKNGDTEWLQGKYNLQIPKILFFYFSKRSYLISSPPYLESVLCK